MNCLIYLFIIPLSILSFSPVYAVNVNKYDWNKTVKWRTNSYGEPIDVCYHYSKGSINYRECYKKASQIFARRCKYGQRKFCFKEKMNQSSTRISKNKKKRPKKTKATFSFK